MSPDSEFEEWFETYFGDPLECPTKALISNTPSMVIQFILNGRPGVLIHDILLGNTDFDNDPHPIPIDLRKFEAIEITVRVRGRESLPETFLIRTLVHEHGPPRWLTMGELAYEICGPQRRWSRILEYHKLLGLDVPFGMGGAGCTLILSR